MVPQQFHKGVQIGAEKLFKISGGLERNPILRDFEVVNDLGVLRSRERT